MEVREPVAKYLARPAFKQTEMGLIPEDWDIKPIAQIAPFQRGFDLPNRELKPGPIPVVYSNGVENFHSVAMVKGPGVVTGRSGTIGKLQYLDTDFWPHNTTLWVTGFNGNVPKFIYYLYCSLEFERFASGSGVPTLNRNDAHSYKLPLPRNTKEQEVIAEALTDADALIEALEQLLAKKRQIKQGAMQELLTGQKRLPGFTGEWISKRLGDVATLKARIGWQGLTTAEYRESGDYYLVTGTEFKNGYIDWSNCFFVDEPRYRQDKNIQIRLHDVLVTKDGTIGKVALINNLPLPATLNSGVFVIRPIDSAFHPEFFYCLLCSEQFTNFLAQLSAGSTINHLYQKDFVGFVFKMPPSIEEQTAIATVLSDMDAGIAAVEGKLAKARQVKQGMMQELLTGRIRLV